MKRLLSFFVVLSLWINCFASVDFDRFFCDSTLRIDYIFSGVKGAPQISVDGFSKANHWAGRRVNLDRLLLSGNGRVVVRDSISDNIIYKNSFSSLFSEWLTQDEAKITPRAYEHTVLIPFPLKTIKIDIELSNERREVISLITHYVNPKDILIVKRSSKCKFEKRYTHFSGNYKDKIDVVILAEGYTINDIEDFFAHADTATQSILSHEPFNKMADKFNFIAVASLSEDKGVSIPRLGEWKKSVFSSHFSTFYSNRYLTTRNVKAIHDALDGVEYEHIIILANTDEYGGGGIFNSYTLTTARNKMFKPVVAHEFGHSFGGLADEYYYDNDIMTDSYPKDIEPWEPNVTTLVNFVGKWENLVEKNTSLPTPIEDMAKYNVGLVEGAAYSSKGIFRSADECRMRSNTVKGFCPACQQAISRIINYYTIEE